MLRSTETVIFAQLLNRLRIGAHTKNDIKILKEYKN